MQNFVPMTDSFDGPSTFVATGRATFEVLNSGPDKSHDEVQPNRHERRKQAAISRKIDRMSKKSREILARLMRRKDAHFPL